MSEFATLSNMPDGIKGILLPTPTHPRLELLDGANRRLLAQSVELLKHHGLPEELLLHYTAAGGETSGAPKLLDSGWAEDHHWLGGQPAVHARSIGYGTYSFVTNSVYHPSPGAVLVDTAAFEMELPIDGSAAGVLSVRGLARYHTDPYPIAGAPAADQIAATNRTANTLREFRYAGSNGMGSWEWLVTGAGVPLQRQDGP